MQALRIRMEQIGVVTAGYCEACCQALLDANDHLDCEVEEWQGKTVCARCGCELGD